MTYASSSDGLYTFDPRLPSNPRVDVLTIEGEPLAARAAAVLSGNDTVNQRNDQPLGRFSTGMPALPKYRGALNIADKVGLATEVCRVLKSGGRFSCVETEQGPGGPPQFPLPWASDPAYSFLVTAETMRAALVGAGLHVIEQIRFHPELAKRGTPPRQAQDIVMGDDFETRLENIRIGTREERLVDQFILAEKPT